MSIRGRWSCLIVSGRTVGEDKEEHKEEKSRRRKWLTFVFINKRIKMKKHAIITDREETVKEGRNVTRRKDGQQRSVDWLLSCIPY